jgi:hypothetical protein
MASLRLMRAVVFHSAPDAEGRLCCKNDEENKISMEYPSWGFVLSCLFEESFTLWKHTQKSLRETQLRGDVSGKGITNTAIALQLLLFSEIGCRWVFDGPETVPTGTRDDGSGFRCAATENDAFIPAHAEGGLDEEARRNEHNALFVQHLLG